MSDRIGAAFAAGKAEGRSLIVPFVTAGYPRVTATVPMVRAMVAAGADMVEIGMPFSDPLADGPTIQRASETALAGGMTVKKTLAAVSALRAAGVETPLILMGYCNPLYAYGIAAFLDAAAAAGVDGLIIADLPPDEGTGFVRDCRGRGISVTFLMAPNAPDERVKTVDRASTHFSYCVTVTGVTGARGDIAARTVEFLQRVRALADKPFVVGFGVKKPEHVRSLAPHADGVVIGSALIDAIDEVADAAAGDEGAARAAAALVAPLCKATRDPAAAPVTGGGGNL